MEHHCPECNREMSRETGKRGEACWRCDYCRAVWTPVELPAEQWRASGECEHDWHKSNSPLSIYEMVCKKCLASR